MVTKVSTKVATNADGFTVAGYNIWRNVTGSTVTVNVPSGKSRFVTARFNAESACSLDAGEVQAWCAVRIVAKRAGTDELIQLHPRASGDFAFDSPGGEIWEGNSVSRSLKLTQSGNWNVWVQGLANVDGKAIGGMFLDDWHFEVETSKGA